VRGSALTTCQTPSSSSSSSTRAHQLRAQQNQGPSRDCCTCSQGAAAGCVQHTSRVPAQTLMQQQQVSDEQDMYVARPTAACSLLLTSLPPWCAALLNTPHTLLTHLLAPLPPRCTVSTAACSCWWLWSTW
jgi:hypothetical protein